MPISNHKFIAMGQGGRSRPMLWIRISNPHRKDKAVPLNLALVDTGADVCLFPGIIATNLGHDLRKGKRKEMGTAGGSIYAYEHTSKIEILETLPDGRPGPKVLFSIAKTPIDYVDDCTSFLLGSEKFLNKFILTVDYPKQIFSIKKPQLMPQATAGLATGLP